MAEYGVGSGYENNGASNSENPWARFYKEKHPSAVDNPEKARAMAEATDAGESALVDQKTELSRADINEHLVDAAKKLVENRQLTDEKAEKAGDDYEYDNTTYPKELAVFENIDVLRNDDGSLKIQYRETKDGAGISATTPVGEDEEKIVNKILSNDRFFYNALGADGSKEIEDGGRITSWLRAASDDVYKSAPLAKKILENWGSTRNAFFDVKDWGWATARRFSEGRSASFVDGLSKADLGDCRMDTEHQPYALECAIATVASLRPDSAYSFLLNYAYQHEQEVPPELLGYTDAVVETEKHRAMQEKMHFLKTSGAQFAFFDKDGHETQNPIEGVTYRFTEAKNDWTTEEVSNILKDSSFFEACYADTDRSSLDAAAADFVDRAREEQGKLDRLGIYLDAADESIFRNFELDKQIAIKDPMRFHLVPEDVRNSIEFGKALGDVETAYVKNIYPILGKDALAAYINEAMKHASNGSTALQEIANFESERLANLEKESEAEDVDTFQELVEANLHWDSDHKCWEWNNGYEENEENEEDDLAAFIEPIDFDERKLQDPIFLKHIVANCNKFFRTREYFHDDDDGAFAESVFHGEETVREVLDHADSGVYNDDGLLRAIAHRGDSMVRPLPENIRNSDRMVKIWFDEHGQFDASYGVIPNNKYILSGAKADRYALMISTKYGTKLTDSNMKELQRHKENYDSMLRA